LIDRWRLFKDAGTIEPGASGFKIDVPVDCAWFGGHFPGEPILPGIALVHLVYEAISARARQRGKSVTLASLKRVRFAGPVRPGDTLQLSLKGEGDSSENAYTFNVSLNQQTVCSGHVSVT